jgi:amidase
MHPLLTQSATGLATAIRLQMVTSVEVVQAHRGWLAQCNPGLMSSSSCLPKPHSNRREADAVLARGKVIGPLNGVPCTAKDIFETATEVHATWQS